MDSRQSPTPTKVVFVGTGVSTAIPVMGHIDQGCACSLAIADPGNKNKRNNVSLMLQLPREDGVITSTDAASHNVLIDCGKTFRDAYFTVLAKYKIRSLTSLLLTHDHMDAIGGVDDLRDLQLFEEQGKHWRCRYYIPTYLSRKTLDTLRRQVPYIVEESVIRPVGAALEQHSPISAKSPELANGGIRERRATCLDLFEVPDDIVSRVHIVGLSGIPTYTLPVIHGEGYVCLGFAFGACTAELRVDGRQCLVYLSDVSRVPTEAMGFLKQVPVIDLLVIDVLLSGEGDSHFSHFCLDQSWELVRELDPIHALGVGMYCSVIHDVVNDKIQRLVNLAQADGSVKRLQSFELAFDKQMIEMSL